MLNEIAFESPFGTWHIASMPPPVDLALYVEHYWETRGVVGYGYEKLIPSGTAEFMINLGPPQTILKHAGYANPASFRNAWLSGIQSAPLFVAPAHGSDVFNTHFVGACVKPSGVCELFGMDAVDTANRVIEAEDVMGGVVRSLRDRIGEALETEHRFDLLSEFLRLQRFRRARLAPTAAIWAVERTLASHGSLRVERLANELGISRKHLNELYKSAVGLSPKTYARLTRFRSVVDRLQWPTEPWARIAAEQGYFDQAHLVRDFNEFAGEPPESFVQNRGPDGESVNYSDTPR